MKEATPLIQVIRLDLAREVQDRRTSGLSLNECPGGVASPGAGTGDRYSQPAARASVSIRHVHRARLAPSGNYPDATLAHDRVVNREIVNADHSKRGIDTGPPQPSHNGI